MLLTCGVFALIRVSLMVLVETQCPDVVHGRLGHGGPRPEPWLEPRQGADGAVLPKPVDAAQVHLSFGVERCAALSTAWWSPSSSRRHPP